MSRASLKYHLLNRTKQTVLALEVELADTSWTRMKGLLGQTSESFTAGKGLWITPSQGVHTIGMKIPSTTAVSRTVMVAARLGAALR